MTVIHREYTSRQKEKYKILKPLAVSPKIKLKNSTIKVHSGGQARTFASRVRPDLRGRRQTVRARSDIIVRGLRDLTTRIQNTLALKRNNRAETFIKDPPSASREGVNALREVVDKLRRRVDDARDSRITVVATNPGDVTLRFADANSRPSDSAKEAIRAELRDLAAKANRTLTETAKTLSEIGDTAREAKLRDTVIATNAATHQRAVDEFRVVATEILQNCAALIRTTTSAIHNNLASDRSLQAIKTELKSFIDPAILSINQKINELNDAILSSYVSVDNLVKRTQPILDQIQSISTAIVLLNNRISDLNTSLSSLSPETNLDPFLNAVSNAKSALEAFTPTATPPASTDAKFSILKIIKNTFEGLTNSIKNSLTKIINYSDKVASAIKTIVDTPNNKARAEQSFLNLNNAVSKLDPSVKNELDLLINQYMSDLASKPELEGKVTAEPRDPTNSVRFPVKPEGMTVKDYQKIISDLMKSYDPVPGKSRQEAPPDLQLDNPQIRALFDKLTSAINDVNNVNNALDIATYNKNIASSITEIAYAIYKNSVLVPAPSRTPIDAAQARLDHATSLRNPEVVGRTESGLVRVYSSLAGHYSRLKSIAGFNNSKNTAQTLKGEFKPENASKDLNAPKPDETVRMTADSNLSSALSSRSLLVGNAFNLALKLGFLTKLKSELDIVLNKLYDSYKSTLETDGAREKNTASKGDYQTKKVSSNQTKESSMSSARALANTVSNTVGSNKERTKFIENLRELDFLTDKNNSMKDLLKKAEDILNTVKDPVKFQLLSKIMDIMKLRDTVDSSIREILTKPDGARDPIDTTREQDARQFAKDELSDALSQLDRSTSNLANAIDSYNKHVLEKLGLDKKTSGIEPADTTSLVAHAEATKQYGGLKRLFSDLRAQTKQQVNALKDQSRDPTTFEPTNKPDNAKPDSTNLNNAKGIKSFLEGLVTRLKSLFVKQDLATKLLQKYADIKRSTDGFLAYIKNNKPDPTNKNDATKAKNEAKRKAKELTPDTTKRDSYDKNKEKLRQLNEKLNDYLDNMNKLENNKALSIFDKNKLLDECRKMLNDLKRQRNELNDRIKSLEKDIRDIQKELKRPDLDPERIKQLKKLRDELLALRDKLNNKLKDLNNKLRDLRDKMNKIKNENSALKRLKDFLNSLKNGIKSIGLSLIPMLAGIGLLAAGTLPFIFAAPAVVSTPPSQPTQPRPRPEADNPNDYNAGYNAGLEAGKRAGELRGKDDGLKAVQKEYSDWVKENPEDKKTINTGQENTSEENAGQENASEENADQENADEENPGQNPSEENAGPANNITPPANNNAPPNK